LKERERVFQKREQERKRVREKNASKPMRVSKKREKERDGPRGDKKEREERQKC